jgi:hypothetical protein
MNERGLIWASALPDCYRPALLQQYENYAIKKILSPNKLLQVIYLTHSREGEIKLFQLLNSSIAL